MRGGVPAEGVQDRVLVRARYEEKRAQGARRGFRKGPAAPPRLFDVFCLKRSFVKALRGALQRK